MNSNADAKARTRLYILTLVFVCGLGSSVSAAAEDGVLMTGYNVQFGGMAASISDSALSREQLCGPDGPMLMLNSINQVADRIGERTSGGGWADSDRQAAVQTIIADMCQQDESFSLEAYAMTYAECRMTMDTASMMTDINMPPGNDPVVMTMNDYYRAESNKMTFDRSMTAAGSFGATMSDINWTGPGDNKQVAGHSATRWNFEYETGMGGGNMAALEAMGMNASITTSGHGYFSTSVPGMRTVQTFFDNFASQIQADQSSSSMFGGMLKTMVQMLQKGIPLEMDTTITSNMRGSGLSGMRTMIKATGVRAVNLADDLCSRNLVPDYFAVTDMNQQMEGLNDSMGGAGMQGAEGMPDMSQSMGEFSKMMEGMTPEQREALSGMGLESMIPGMGANPAGQAQQAPAPAPAASSTRSGPSSAELTTDNMVQSVQLHLQALGIDPGNTSGEMDLDTQIAISQFQAQKGMKPTGEVTPQLLGVLSAEVDSGR